jgi:hypothetical protein
MGAFSRPDRRRPFFFGKRRIQGAAVSALAGLCLLAACQPSAPRRGPEGTESAGPDGSPVATGAAVPACPNARRVAAGAGHRRQGRLQADLDGRPGRERAFVTLTRSGGVDCRAWLVAEGSFGRTVVPVAGTDPFAFESLGLPALAGAARIDDTGGAEIMVDVTTGASTTFAAVFTVQRDTVVKVDARGPGAPSGDLFAYGGSVAHLDAVDCAGPATVVISRARADALRYSITRHYFSAEGPVWRALPRRAERGKAVPRRLAARWPEFGSFPFSSCEAPSD